MDLSPSPPDLQNSSPEIVTDYNMATAAVAHSPNIPGPPHSAPPASNAATNSNNSNNPTKRYRPAPAKTFQCRGYGECRMVFSRSEHLARHIRKHTGERPFSCHCSKQFSRLDNLRQHAQTVHADKQEENERMMRELTSLHATMSAANKIGGSRRKPSSAANASNMVGGNAMASAGAPLILIKQENSPVQHHHRPGTSTGYESGEVMYPYESSSAATTVRSRNASNSSFRDKSQSFRESSQSFLGPPNMSSATGAAPAALTQSFLGYSKSQHNVVSDIPSRSLDGPSRPSRPSSSRPTTSSGFADSQHSRSLPPLAAVVSASLPSAPVQYQPPSSSGYHSTSSQQQQQQQLHQSQSIFPFQSTPNDHIHSRRPSTAYRPVTAPASASFFNYDRSGLGSSSGRPDLSLLHSGFGGRPTSSSFGDQHYQHYQLGDSGDPSTSPGNDPSPFYFNPPAISSAAATSASPVSINPRKRAYGGPDGPSEDSSQLRADRPNSSASLLGEHNYEYESESRPQSRRLTVMELCTEDKSPRPTSQRREQYSSGSGAILSLPASAGNPYGSTSSRPTTSSGLVSSTSTLRLFDRPASPSASTTAYNQQPTHVLSRASYAAGGSNGDGGDRGTAEIGRGSGLSSASFTRLPPSATSSAFPISPTHSSSPTSTPTFTSPGVLSHSSSASDAYPDATSGGSHRGFYPQQQQYQQSYQHHKQAHPSQYQLSHSPTFSSTSSASNASYSPRSPLSDSSSSSGSPFPAYATRSTTVFAGGHATSANSYASSGISAQPHHHQQRDGQIRASASPHPATFGMRV